jgi:hypothetical protein
VFLDLFNLAADIEHIPDDGSQTGNDRKDENNYPTGGVVKGRAG